MSPNDHDLGALGSYVLGALDDGERRSVEEHLVGCEGCREERIVLEETERALGELPPEAFLEGPPDDADLLLQRTLRQVRAEAKRRDGRRWAGVAAAVAVVLFGAAGGGALVARSGNERQPVASPPSVAPTVPAPPPGTKVGSVSDPVTGARATVRVVPAAGWVRVTAAVSGIPAGQRCRLWVVSKDGNRQLAGSWLVSERAAHEGTTLDGSALVTPSQVAAVEVDNFDGNKFVSVSV